MTAAYSVARIPYQLVVGSKRNYLCSYSEIEFDFAA